MKKIFLIPGIALLMTACHTSSDPKAELEKLKKQEMELKGKIAVLEASLNTIKDSAAGGTAVSAAMLKPEIFKNYINIQGRVDADENVSISSEMPGTIVKINVKVGDAVVKGQVLAETDAIAINQSIADLQTNTDLVNQIFQKQKNLWDQKIGTEIQFLQAKTNKESMEKKMASLLQQLSMTKIVSPINGTVDAVDIKVGQLTAPGMPSIRVINFSNLKVKADVSEGYASKIKKGSEVIVHFPDTDDSIISTVNYTARAINPSTRSFTVEVLLDNQKEYHPNMVARLNINDYKSAHPVIIIPIRTILRDETNASFVIVADGNKAKKQIITLGRQYNGMAEVTSGLKEGDMLITAGYDVVNDGDAIIYKK